MTTLEDFAKTLKGIVAAQRRPQPKLTNAEIGSITEIAKPFFDAYEAMIAELRSAQPPTGPAWYGYSNDGTEYTGEQKREVVHAWMEANKIENESSLLRATLGEKGTGPRARGPVTFYTFPSSDGVVALWVARSDNLSLLQGMVSSVVGSDGDESDE